MFYRELQKRSEIRNLLRIPRRHCFLLALVSVFHDMFMRVYINAQWLKATKIAVTIAKS